MKKITSRNIRFFALCAAILIMSACVPATTQSTDEARTTRAPAARPYILGGKKELDPMEQHMRARKMVDPGDTSPTHRYTYLAEDYQARIAGKRSKAVAGKPDSSAVVPAKKPLRNLASAIPAAKPQSKSEAVVTPASKPVSKKKAVKVASAKKPASKPVVKSSGANVTAVRIGNHPDKTRLVLDVSGSAQFDYKMDQKKNVLIITLKGTGWDTEAKRVFSSHNLLMAYLAKPIKGGGTMLAIKMKKPATLLFKTTYPPSSGKGYRIVLDVAPA